MKIIKWGSKFFCCCLGTIDYSIPLNYSTLPIEKKERTENGAEVDRVESSNGVGCPGVIDVRLEGRGREGGGHSVVVVVDCAHLSVV